MNNELHTAWSPWWPCYRRCRGSRAHRETSITFDGLGAGMLPEVVADDPSVGPKHAFDAFKD